MAGPNKKNLSIDASVVISTEYSKLRKKGGEHILLSNKGRNLYVSVCLHFYYVKDHSSNRFHIWRVCSCGPKGVQCCILQQYGHATRSELIHF